MIKNNLKLDWCSYDAAKYACKNWHYSKCVPLKQPYPKRLKKVISSDQLEDGGAVPTKTLHN